MFQFFCGDGKAGAPTPSQPMQAQAPPQLALAAPPPRPRPSTASSHRSRRVQLSLRDQERSVSRRRRRSRAPSHSRPKTTGNVPAPTTYPPGQWGNPHHHPGYTFSPECAKLAHLAVFFTPKAVSATCTSSLVPPTTAVASSTFFWDASCSASTKHKSASDANAGARGTFPAGPTKNKEMTASRLIQQGRSLLQPKDSKQVVIRRTPGPKLQLRFNLRFKLNDKLPLQLKGRRHPVQLYKLLILRMLTSNF